MFKRTKTAAANNNTGLLKSSGQFEACLPSAECFRCSETKGKMGCFFTPMVAIGQRPSFVQIAKTC